MPTERVYDLIVTYQQSCQVEHELVQIILEFSSGFEPISQM